MTLAVLAHMPYREVLEMDDRELATLDDVVQAMNEQPKRGGKGAGPRSQRHNSRPARP